MANICDDDDDDNDELRKAPHILIQFFTNLCIFR